MNTEMAYLLGMILGNGEIQQDRSETKITIDIPHKNLYTDDMKEAAVYVKASLIDIQSLLEPLLAQHLTTTQTKRSTQITFTKKNEEYVMREILRFIGAGKHHSTMKMNDDLFSITSDEKKALLRGIADVTAYIRESNIAFNKKSKQHRVYIEIPGNWYMVIDIADMLKSLDIPIQTIDFGHPNCRDTNLKFYNLGKQYYWKKEHQIKIFANEFLPIGFNIQHKQDALEKYAKELLKNNPKLQTHKFYWEKRIKTKKIKAAHPCENDNSLPIEIRGKHFNSWQELARILGYGE